MADGERVIDHLRAAREIGTRVANEGRHADTWLVYKNSAKSVLTAAPGTHTSKQLQLALSKAKRQPDACGKALTMQEAFDDVLSRRPVTSSSAMALDLGRGSHSRPATPLAPDLQYHLLQRRNDSDSMRRACSTPSLCGEMLDTMDPAFSSSTTPDGWRTSHYTKMGAPKTNAHYRNTLRGANKAFNGVDVLSASDAEFYADAWRTSNDAFFGRKSIALQRPWLRLD
eukprot:TRINITY_DN33362_c0_g1_i1.p1 TRINITY_DN33362_c0_g1~~TRINITY_DN33362_c0_g1_i1.p1  ORF type:complete len:242 (-),score=38.11 TRINITY_DN33362_c0_g1_i1:320-1000(-)